MPADSRGNHGDLRPQKFAKERFNGSTLLKILPYKPTWSQSALHKHKWRDKTANWMNRERQMYKCHEYFARCRHCYCFRENFQCPADLIIHNYWSNQSALMTRCRTDSHHQHGIFCGESKTSFSWSAIRARGEEGRLFSQPNLWNTTPWLSIEKPKSITKRESLVELKRALEALRLWLYSLSIWRCPKLTLGSLRKPRRQR